MKKLADKICVVTGAARGIGLAICEAFLREGATVILTDKDTQTGQQEADRLGCTFFALDVAQEDQWQKLQSSIPMADIVVNNAGITGFEKSTAPHDPEHASLADWQQVHRVNLDGTFLGCRYAIAAMKEQKSGAIINISSRSGMVGIPAAAAYASSKAAVRNHTKSVALYCAQQGWTIRCNSIHPAAILTPMWEPMLGNGPDREQRMESFVADTPLRRFGAPEEVANLCVMLGSDDCAYMTGTELTVDGGLLAGAAATPER